MSIVSLKLGLLVAVFASGWVGGIIPLRRAMSESPRFLSWGNAFAAGIFLGIGLIHMLGDASATWSKLGWNYPMALLLAGAAFLLLLWFEHVALSNRAHRAVHEPGGVIDDLDEAPHRHEEVGHHGVPGAEVSGIYPYALIVALSVHSFIAGVAMGAQDTLANVVLLFIAVLAHKSTAGFALGVSLARNHVPRRRSLGLIGVFAAVTPVGILVGLVVTSALAGHALMAFNATFLSLAAGSFLYIAAFDIIRDEFLRPGPRAVKWLLTATGYGLMGLLALWL